MKSSEKKAENNIGALLCTVFLFVAMPINADQTMSIPQSYLGVFGSEGGAVVEAIIRGGRVALIEENGRARNCVSNKVNVYKTGFIFRKEVVRVACQNASIAEVRRLNRLFKTNHVGEGVQWVIFLVKEDDFILKITDCLEPFRSCSQNWTVGHFYKY